MKKALEGIKVLDWTRSAAGPWTARFLGEHGATVIKVETVDHPDVMRTSFPYKDNISGINRSGYWTKFNAGKMSILLNLDKPQAVDIFKRLVKWADVLIESNAPGVAKKYGLDYEEIRKINPNIIMASTSQLGQTGPHAQFKGYGAQSAAMAGFHAMAGYPDGNPVGPFGAYTDLISHQPLVSAIIAALLYRHRTGKGQFIDQSQMEMGVHYLAATALDYAINGRIMSRAGNRDPYASPHGCYRCRGDDRWCVITVFSDEEWEAFCQVIGNPQWTQDPRFATLSGRKENEDELDRLVDEWTVNYSPEEVMTLMQMAGVAAGIVANGEDLHRDPQLKYRKHFQVLDHQEMGPHALETPPYKLSKTPSELTSSGPLFGEHNEYICKQILGMSDDEIADLTAQGVFE